MMVLLIIFCGQSNYKWPTIELQGIYPYGGAHIEGLVKCIHQLCLYLIQDHFVKLLNTMLIELWHNKVWHGGI